MALCLSFAHLSFETAQSMTRPVHPELFVNILESDTAKIKLSEKEKGTLVREGVNKRCSLQSLIGCSLERGRKETHYGNSDSEYQQQKVHSASLCNRQQIQNKLTSTGVHNNSVPTQKAFQAYFSVVFFTV